MNSAQIVDFLITKNINFIYHANSVSTSSSFIKLGGLASRSLVARNNFPQTSQYTDDTDKRLNVWNDIFTDSVDIHQRILNINHYGPVLFEIDVNILRNLPIDARILITKSNPSKWETSTIYTDRYFTDISELTQSFTRGNFDQMITIHLHSGFLSFDNYLKRIIIDDPNDVNVFDSAIKKLNHENIVISKRFICAKNGCKCFRAYANNSKARSLFD